MPTVIVAGRAMRLHVGDGVVDVVDMNDVVGGVVVVVAEDVQTSAIFALVKGPTMPVVGRSCSC